MQSSLSTNVFFHQVVFEEKSIKVFYCQKVEGCIVYHWCSGNQVQIAHDVVIVYVTYYVLDVEAWTCWCAHGGDGSDAGGICG